MNQYTTRCSEQQTKKALELGAPIYTTPYFSVLKYEVRNFFVKDDTCYYFPTTEQMLGWLEEKGISISIEYKTTNLYSVSLEGLFGYIPLGADSRTEATLAAIDAALDLISKTGE